MINANELRIGNFIKFNNFIQPEKVVTITARFFSSLAGGRPESEIKHDEKLSGYYFPIPLTPEILKKCGFRCTIIQRRIYYNLDSFYFVQLKSTGEFKYGKNTKIKYLHQLQNLYFALTREELKIDL